jgi:hypothetical protein
MFGESGGQRIDETLAKAAPGPLLAVTLQGASNPLSAINAVCVAASMRPVGRNPLFF